MNITNRTKLKINRFFVYLFLVVLVVITLIPLWLLIVNATRSTVEIQQGISLLPSKYLISNYKILLSKGLDLPLGFMNSLTIAVLTTVLTVYFSMLTAYGLVAYNFKGKKAFFNTILVLVMIPMQLSIIGFYQWMTKLGLDDNYASLILPSIASAGSVFLPSNTLTPLFFKTSSMPAGLMAQANWAFFITLCFRSLCRACSPWQFLLLWHPGTTSLMPLS